MEDIMEWTNESNPKLVGIDGITPLTVNAYVSM